jgi:hypothetical protein
MEILTRLIILIRDHGSMILKKDMVYLKQKITKFIKYLDKLKGTYHKNKKEGVF